MSMSFGGNPYAPMMEALMRRREQLAQQQQSQPQQQMQPIGGTMQLQPGQFGGGGGGNDPTAAALSGMMPSASSMTDMLNRYRKWSNAPQASAYGDASHFANAGKGPSSGMDV